MKIIVFYCVIVTIVTFILFFYISGSYIKINDVHKAMKSVAEAAYFHGQKDAKEGDWKIEWNESSKSYIWIASPWDGDSFIPRTPDYLK